MARAKSSEARRLRALLDAHATELAAKRDGYSRGKAALLRGDGEAAATAFRSHLRKHAGSYSARVGLGAALAATGRRAAATRVFAELGLVEAAGEGNADERDGQLHALGDLAWEVLGEHEVDLATAARARYDANDLRRALALAQLAGLHDLAAYTRFRLGQLAPAVAAAKRAAQGGKRARRAGLGAETAATLLIDGGQPELAAALLGELAKSDRSNWYDAGGDDRRTLGWSGLALVRFRAGEYTQALAAVAEARAVRPGAEGALLLEVASLAALGFAERAKKALAAIERHHPLRDLAWGGLRRSELETALTGRPQRRRAALEEATRAFEAGAARDDASGRQRLRDAIACYRTALGTRPATCEPAQAGLLRWAVAHAWLGERAAAVAVAKRLIAVDRDDQSALRVIAWAGAGASAAKAYRAAGLGPQLYGALAPTARSLGRFRALPARDAVSPLRRSLRARAEQLVYYGVHQAALEVYDALSLSSSEAARYLAAYAANELGDRARAWRYLAPYLRAHVDTSYYAQPIDAWWLGEKVAPAAKRGWVTRTLEALWSEPARRAPDPAVLAQRALHAEAFAAERAGRFDDALARYLDALEAHADASLAGNAANVLVQRGELARADHWFAIVRARLGDLTPPLRQGWQLAKLAWRYLQGGQPGRAARIAARAVELTRSPGDSHTLAEARLGAGDPKGARAAIVAGLQIDPSHDELRALRSSERLDEEPATGELIGELRSGEPRAARR